MGLDRLIPLDRLRPLAGLSVIYAPDDRDLSTPKGSPHHMHATVESALGRREIRQRAGACSSDEAR